MSFLSYIQKKINNQIAKIKKLAESRRLKDFKKHLMHCGNNVSLAFPVKFEGIEYISLGNNVSINSFVHIWGHGQVSIGDDSLIASHVSIISVTHNIHGHKFRESIIEKPVTIGSNVWIGAHSVILPGVTIGNNVVVGAGSIVTKDLAENSVYVGSPAKKTKSLTQFDME